MMRARFTIQAKPEPIKVLQRPVGAQPLRGTDCAAIAAAHDSEVRVAKAQVEEQATDAKDVGALNDILGFHIRLAHGAAYRHFTETFTDLGLTQKQVSALWLVADHPGIGQSDLGRRLQMDRATVMAIVNRLAARGYVERSDHRGDARRRALSLLPEGAAALERAKIAIRADDAWLKGRFSKREVAQLIALLSRIHS